METEELASIELVIDYVEEIGKHLDKLRADLADLKAQYPDLFPDSYK